MLLLPDVLWTPPSGNGRGGGAAARQLPHHHLHQSPGDLLYHQVRSSFIVLFCLGCFLTVVTVLLCSTRLGFCCWWCDGLWCCDDVLCCQCIVLLSCGVMCWCFILMCCVVMIIWNVYVLWCDMFRCFVVAICCDITLYYRIPLLSILH